MLITMWLLAIVIWVLLVAACGRGTRLPGPSWFDIAHDDNRAARRARR